MKRSGGKADDGIGRGQDRLGRAVVLLEGDDRRRRREGVGKVEDVADPRGAEGIDRLGVVADHGEAAAVGPEAEQDRGLEAVGVLVLVDQHVVEAGGEVGGDRRVLHHPGPVEEEVVIVEDGLALLGLDIGGEQLAQALVGAEAPGEGVLQHLAERRLGVDGARVDREAGALLRKALLGPRQAELVADDGHEVGRILAVEDGEVRREADGAGIFAEQPRADGVEGARPRQRRRRLAAERVGDDPLDPPAHLGGGAAGEGQEQDAVGVGAGDDVMGDAVGERRGLAGAGAGDDQQRTARRWRRHGWRPGAAPR